MRSTRLAASRSRSPALPSAASAGVVSPPASISARCPLIRWPRPPASRCCSKATIRQNRHRQRCLIRPRPGIWSRGPRCGPPCARSDGSSLDPGVTRAPAQAPRASRPETPARRASVLAAGRAAAPRWRRRRGALPARCVRSRQRNEPRKQAQISILGFRQRASAAPPPAPASRRAAPSQGRGCSRRRLMGHDRRRTAEAWPPPSLRRPDLPRSRPDACSSGTAAVVSSGCHGGA